jgi:aryl-alcohol dehydrogenase-like predicted oxidoreductase
LGVIVRGGVAKGEPGIGKGRAEHWARFEAAHLDELREPGESRTAFMLRYTLTHPEADTIIVGTLDPEHVARNVGALARGPLPLAVYSEARRRLTAAGVAPSAVPQACA